MAELKPCTFADRIRAMSDEELADFLANRYVIRNIAWCDNEWGELTETQKKAEQRTMFYAWLKWLKQPAFGDER